MKAKISLKHRKRTYHAGAVLFFLFIAAVLFSRPALAIVNIELYRKDPAPEGLSGDINGSLTESSGNAEFTERSASIVAFWGFTNQEWLLACAREFGESSNDAYLDNALLHGRYLYGAQRFLGFEVFLQIEKDEFQDLKQRDLAGTGVRLKLQYEKGVISHHVGLGGFEEREKYTEHVDPENEVNARVNLYWSLYWTFGDKNHPLTVGNVYYYQPNTRKENDVRSIDIFSFSWRYAPYLAFNWAYKYKYDSDPLPGLKKTNYKSNLSISIKF